MRPTPILFLSDNPTASTGLARITRNIAGQLSRSPKFRVGTLGMCGNTSRKLPFAQYTFPQDGYWGMPHLQEAWQDFAGKEHGIVMTIWDVTRTIWLSRPEFCLDPELAKWLGQGHFDLWGYVTLDYTGPQDRLSGMATDSLMGYRRLLAYTQWGQGVIERSTGQPGAKARGLDWLPHGLDLRKWEIRDKAKARERFYPLVHEGDRLTGAIGTNQARKDWGLVASICQQLLSRDKRSRFWWHVDRPEHIWSINSLLQDFGLRDTTVVTQYMSGDELCWCYNACDLTLHPGLGEGFGYPIFESLACGTPVLHGDYAGGADVLRQCGHDAMLVTPEAWRLDGIHSQVRPVYDPTLWADTVETRLATEYDREVLRASVAHLGWDALWPSWQRWFEEGL